MKPERVEPVRYSQGKLLAWNAETFENRVEFGDGAIGVNVPVKSAANALGFAPGQTVALLGWNGSWWIDGQIVVPGTGAAEQAVAFLRSQLAASIVDDLVEQLLTSPAGIALAAFVLGNRVTFDQVDVLESTTSTSYVDLGTVGPTVSGVEVTDSGKALVFVSANLSAVAGEGANMSFEVSGATSIAAGATGTLSLATAGGSTSAAGSVTKIVPLTLNPGTHSFQAKYRSGSGGLATFNQRNLTVFAF